MDELLCLIADDEPALRRYLSALLQCKGIQTVEAQNAVEALRILQKLHGKIDLLITDIQMPGDMDGLDLAYSVRNSFPSVPVILISGACEKAPVDFTFVRKPFSANVMLSIIDNAIGVKARAAG